MASGTSIDPGLRDRVVTIQAVTSGGGSSSSGFPVDDITTLAEAWMSKRDLTGRERYAMGQLTATVECVFEMPYRADMDPESMDLAATRRLVYKGRTYDIVRAEMRARRDGVLLFCLARPG